MHPHAQVQILSHQSKIATQIELFVGHGDSYETAHFRRLGYLSLNSNERSKYQARELKSVYVNAPGQYLRMLVHKCYINEVNLFNQVGEERAVATTSRSPLSRQLDLLLHSFESVNILSLFRSESSPSISSATSLGN